MSKDELPNWVCIPDDDGSHLTTYVAKDDSGFGGCPIHEIAGGCSIPQPDLANLIAQEANKARIDERKRFDDEIDDVLTRHSKNPDLSPLAELRDYNYNAISSLTADKEPK